MTRAFTIGDRVRIHNIELGDHGREGTLIDIEESSDLWPCIVRFDGDERETGWPFAWTELRHVKAAKP